MPPNLIDITVGNMPIKAPVIVDADTTLQIAKLVNARIAEIESETTRIDSHLFALLAAMSFAAELEQTKQTYAAQIEELQQERARDARDLIVELSDISDALAGIVRYLDEP